MAYQGFKFGDDLPSYSQKLTFAGLNSLTIDSDYDVNVKFINSPDGTDYIDVSGNMEKETINKLKNADTSAKNFTLDLTRKSKWSFLQLNFQSNEQQITVALADPAKLEQFTTKLGSNNGTFSELNAGNINISGTSGNLNTSSVTAKQIIIKTTSGNITANDMKGDTEIKLTSGNIKVTNLDGSATLLTTSGNIKAENVKGSADVSLVSGDIKFDNFIGNGTFKSTSGNITLNNQRSDSLDITAHSGNVNLSADPEFKGIYDLRATSGNIQSPDSPMKTKDVIKIRVTCGNIKIKN
ncbi:DUF4097 family beta strand repeat-containing protein [Paenibacillus sp. D2_2]|uniref:DUF4097 family beta strand repeat-containing protein n=1 Tax=Paenibacillus sp. D2_2 TaxID=3073092 RepID=UPI0028154009|nr:DUF4097 family beta strand repeat-containing protein [Paenibacillus sp. D2_2]WMT40753.1 DUF4097 family beta strand repeat-containing protein [Paenibacillus sp. D2_2]